MTVTLRSRSVLMFSSSFHTFGPLTFDYAHAKPADQHKTFWIGTVIDKVIYAQLSGVLKNQTQPVFQLITGPNANFLAQL